MDVTRTTEEISRDLERDKVLVAYRKLQALKEYLHKDLESNIEGRELTQGILNAINENQRFRALEDDAQVILALLNDFAQQEGWNLVHNRDNIKTWYRHEPGNPIHSIKMEGVIYAPIFNVCSVIYECDLYSLWVPRVVESRTLATPSRFRKNTYCRLSVPWPIASRDTCLYGMGVDMLEEASSVVVLARSCRETDPEHNHVVPPRGIVRVNTNRAGFLLRPLSATSTHIQIITNTDPQMALIPYWLLNMVTTHLAHLSFTTLQSQSSQCSHPSSPYLERINSNPIYSELKQILANIENNNNTNNIPNDNNAG